jgi:hypothetical protein
MSARSRDVGNNAPKSGKKVAAADVTLADIVSALTELLEQRDREHAAAIEALTTTIAEQKADLAAVHERLDRLFAPVQPPQGYIALRKAAAMIGRSDEYLRQRAARGEIGAEIIGGKWFVDSAAVGALAIPNESATWEESNHDQKPEGLREPVRLGRRAGRAVAAPARRARRVLRVNAADH